ncbi:MAG: NgoFVII family restriction endonuclease [Candidatus Melainabacteria bacterium]|nr:NgoFVII family restriction endonuclease [Candidatus Melainabacteria bacterium]
MKLLTSGAAVLLEQLTRKCKRLRWAVAWASSSFSLFEVLKENQHKIHQIVVGTHFYQTHPDFIDEFLDNERVRFVLNPEGVFHPKLYLFEHGDDSWDCIVGSSNFTKNAFSRNYEVSVHFDSSDVEDRDVYEQIDACLNHCFSNGKTFNENSLAEYRSIWKRQQPRLGKLAGHYSVSDAKELPKVSPLEVPLFVMKWSDYFDSVSIDQTHTIEGRLAVLEEARRLFESSTHFNQLDDDCRKGIAGFLSRGALDWKWFGSMQGHGYFKRAISENNSEISAALDEIPLTGPVTRLHFDKYLSIISNSFRNAGIGTITRLISMKRPDYFVCFDSKNRDRLCSEFGIRKNVSPDMYWDKIIARVLDSNWWNSPEPTSLSERRIWRCRVAFLDVRYYES